MREEGARGRARREGRDARAPAPASFSACRFPRGAGGGLRQRHRREPACAAGADGPADLPAPPPARTLRWLRGAERLLPFGHFWRMAEAGSTNPADWEASAVAFLRRGYGGRAVASAAKNSRSGPHRRARMGMRGEEKV